MVGPATAEPVADARQSSITFSADPLRISPGQSVTLKWTLTSGTFVDVEIDQGIRLTEQQKGASGTVTVAPEVTTTYQILVTTSQGQATAQATVWVDPSKR